MQCTTYSDGAHGDVFMKSRTTEWNNSGIFCRLVAISRGVELLVTHGVHGAQCYKDVSNCIKGSSHLSDTQYSAGMLFVMMYSLNVNNVNNVWIITQTMR